MFRWKVKKLTKETRKDAVVKNSGTFVVLGLSLLAITFVGVCNPNDGSNSSRGGSSTAATVAGETISATEFQRAYRNTYSRLQQQYGDQFDPGSIQVASLVLDGLVADHLRYVAATQLGIRAHENDVLRVLEEADVFKDEKTKKFSEDKFKNFLKSQRYHEADLRDEIVRGLSAQKVRQFVSGSTYTSRGAAALDYRANNTKLTAEYVKIEREFRVDIPEADVQAFASAEANAKAIQDYYDSHKDEYNTPKKVHARHILVSYQGARGGTGATRSKEEAQKRALEVTEKVRKAGTDFAATAREMTDEASGKTSGGDLGFFAKEAMVKEFSDAAFQLAPGQMSQVVESPFGFHVIKVEAVKEGTTTTLDHAKAQIARKLVEKDRRPKIVDETAQAILAAAKKGEDTSSLLKGANLSWKTTPEFTPSSRFVPGLGSSEAMHKALLVMKSPGSVHDSVIDDQGAKYIVRLKSRNVPDAGKTSEKDIDTAAENETMTTASALIAAYDKNLRSKLDERGEIWQNPAFQKLDQEVAERKKKSDETSLPPPAPAPAGEEG